MTRRNNRRQVAQGWPADRVERRPLDKLVPAARNARTHSSAQIQALAKSMKEWGFTNPVLVDERGRIIAGHGRVLAAQSLGWKEVPVMIARGWTPAQKRAYLLADNQLALGAGWDRELLAVEIGDLKAAEFDVGVIGFGPGELADILGTRAGQALDTSPKLTEGFKFGVLIEAASEADQAEKLRRFEGEGMTCRPVVTQ